MRLRTWMTVCAAGALLVTAACTSPKPEAPPPAAAAAAAGALNRTVLPIPEPAAAGHHRAGRAQGDAAAALRGEGARGRAERAHRPHRRHGLRHVQRLRRPRPHADRRTACASKGLRYNQFHTTALCSPTRTALLSGRNHHTNNMGAITEMATAFPGNTGQRPDSVTPLAEMLRLNGYNTALRQEPRDGAPGKSAVSGPTDRWPTRSGFDKFYGFIGGETNQWAPVLYDGFAPVELPKDPNYHFMTDMTNKAIAWVQFQKALTPDRPFFMYFAPGAMHAPHHVPKEWIAKYKGKFDQGWDGCARKRSPARSSWASCPPARSSRPSREASRTGTRSRPTKRSSSRDRWRSSRLRRIRRPRNRPPSQSHRGHGPAGQYARLLHRRRQRRERRGRHERPVQRDDATSTASLEMSPDMLKHYDEWGGPSTYPHMAAGWAVAGDTPFTWTKQVASNFGGTRNGHDHVLAEADHGEGRSPLAVPSRHRRRADRPRGGRAARAEERQRHRRRRRSKA